MNIFIRAKYHVLIPVGPNSQGNIDNGISFNIGIMQKLTPNKNATFGGNRHTVEYRYPIIEALIEALLK